jgi:DNA replication protein DnaC
MESITQFYKDYSKDRSKATEGFLIVGGPNSGKTHLAVAIIGELMRRNVPGLRFFDTTELLRKLDPNSGLLDKRGRKELLVDLESAGLIVLDDFGSVEPTESEMEQLDYLVDAHYRAMRPMIITTRHSQGNLDNVFSPRIISRLFSMTTALDLG